MYSIPTLLVKNFLVFFWVFLPERQAKSILRGANHGSAADSYQISKEEVAWKQESNESSTGSLAVLIEKSGRGDRI